MKKRSEAIVTSERVPGFGKPKQDDSLTANAEYQRRRVMSKDDRAFDARGRVAQNIKRQAEREGRDSTFADALKKATEIANQQYRKDREDGKR